jgi:hypothetical protein
MIKHIPASANRQQISYPDHSFYDDRVEEPPFVYLGARHPPDIASDLPGHVFNFEKAWKEAGPVSVYELLGKPVFRGERELTDTDIEKELPLILGTLHQNGIIIEIPPGGKSRDVYRYITEFLFNQEVDDLKLGGLGRHFFYREDFDS